ncbi:MAG: hypothetical protein H6838_11650 [Planctomycetes bacterium]|nr:hypothetical protein [Planctomycetota bacterium]MCB9886140.1 hypothetical protein [Planctomycetota bacterium]
MNPQIDGVDSHGFLGEEFLTWIWFRWETDGGEFPLPGGRVVGVALDDFLTFAAPSDDETEQTLRRGLPTRTAEARTALRQGHRLRKARLLIAEGERQWNVTLDAPSLSLAGVKLPEDAEECETEADRTADRAANWLALHEIVQALYASFLRERLRPDYLGTVAEQQAQWMAS